MTRATLFVIVLVCLVVAGGRAAPSTGAQGDDPQATVLADPQTRVARLETAVAGQPVGGTATLEAVVTVTAASGTNAGAGTKQALYRADAHGGFAQWTDTYRGGFGNPWQVKDGNLVYGKGYYTIIYAPYLPRTPDYAVEAELRVTSIPTGEDCGCFPNVGLVLRFERKVGGTEAGYSAGEEWNLGKPPKVFARIQAAPFDTLGESLDVLGAGLPAPTSGWHTYRFEAQGSRLRFLIDGRPVLEATDARFHATGVHGRVGVAAAGVPVEVRRFAVLSL